MADPIIVSRGGELIPDWRDNLTRDPVDQIVVRYRFITAEEQQRIISRARQQARGIEDEDDRLTEMLTVQWFREAEAMIQNISNLAVQDETGEVKKITTGAELLEDPSPEMVELSYIVLTGLRSAGEVSKKK